MASASAYVAFLRLVLDLQSLPLFGAYLLMIALSGLWQQKIPAVTGLRPVSKIFFKSFFVLPAEDWA